MDSLTLEVGAVVRADTLIFHPGSGNGHLELKYLWLRERAAFSAYRSLIVRSRRILHCV